MRRAIGLLLGSVLMVSSASAGKKAGVTLPDRIEISGRQLTLNGMGLREATVLKVDVYVAGLYVETPSSDPATLLGSKETKQLVLRFKREVDRGQIVEAWNAGFKGNATVPLSTIEAEVEKFNSWMNGFKSGDTLVLTSVPGRGLYVDINGIRKGEIANEEFARSVFAIWLGPKPPTSALKKGLLGKH